MGRKEQITFDRLKKIDDLREAGVNPYPNKFDVKDSASDLHLKFEKLKDGEKSKVNVSVAGRLLTSRKMGKIMFGTLDDGSARLQIVVQQGDSPKKVFEFFKAFVDGGDFVGVRGHVFKTERGELSVLASDVQVLAKAILPLPEKFHGLQDEEERLRKRYLDIAMNPEVREMFVRKSKFWATVRSFLLDRKFLEVETPVLENSAGGAAATPFRTHHNALDIDVFLRISQGELWQKKLMVAGLPRTFEIGRQFRNEGMDADHLQDYTQMEFYWAFANFEDGMGLVEEMFKKIASVVYGKYKFERSGHKFDLSKSWKRVDYVSEIKKQMGLDVLAASREELAAKLSELKEEFDPKVDKPRLTDILWKVCRRKISGPAFLVNHPVAVAPLAKRNPNDPSRVEMFQVLLGGSELGTGYSELNDPVDQEERFKEQQRLNDAGDSEAQEHDEGFVEALRYGMPPTCGFGFSERLFSFFEGRPMRETVIFPLMRPLPGEAKASPDPVLAAGDIDLGKLPMERKSALKLVKQHNSDQSDLNHYLESEAVLRALARHLNEDVEAWGMLGLVHDIDWGATKGDVVKHLTLAPKLLVDAGFSDEFVNVVVSHGFGFPCAGLQDKKRSHPVEHALACGETVTGLVHAYSRMKPIDKVEVKGLLKKFRDKKFAAAVDRGVIRECEKLGLSLEEFLQLAIDAIKGIRAEVGL